MPPVPPGEGLREDSRKPPDRSANKLALELDAPATRIGKLCV